MRRSCDGPPETLEEIVLPMRILVTATGLHEKGRQVLSRAGCDVRFETAPEAIAAAVRDWQPHGILSRTVELPGEVMRRGRDLSAIVKHGAGVNNIDVESATRQGIPVFATPGANAHSVAEFTVALILSVCRQVPRFDREVRDGLWDRRGEGRQFSGMTLGLVGYGRIARRVARMAACLGMSVAATDPFGDAAAARRAGVKWYDGLDDLLAGVDVLSLHCPAERGAPPIIDAARLEAMKPGAFLVNTARGELVDEAALAAALASGHLAGAALDTLQQEPPVADHPLLTAPNAILTPHVGGSTPEALEAMAVGAATTLVSYLRDLASGGAPGEEIWSRCVNRAGIEGRAKDIFKAPGGTRPRHIAE